MKSLLVFPGSLLYTLLFFLSVLVLGSFVLLPDPIIKEKKRWQILDFFSRVNFYLCRVLCGLSYEAIGLENVPKEPCVVFLKHASVYEAFFALSILQPSSFVAKYELMFVPILRGALKALRCIPVRRGLGKREVSKVLAQGERCLIDGRWIVVCPEGTRVPYGETKRYGISGALLAKAVGSPVLPIAHNAGYYWGRRSLIKKPGLITFSVGKPIETDNKNAQEINQAAQSWIEEEISKMTIK
jgi:1-acyl-sn-glycerol-3-phosphate acyltransferase